MLVFIFFYVPSSKLGIFILIYFDLVVTIEHMEIIAAKLVENAVIQNNVIISTENAKMGVTVVTKVTSVMRVSALLNFI